MSERLLYEFGDRTISDLIGWQKDGRLNLDPAFQRDSVWTKSDRRKLIQSILDGYPIPSIFLYRREENGWPIYDVLDGKQRLETIFMFTRAPGFLLRHFDPTRRESTVKYRFGAGEDDQYRLWRWKEIQRHGHAAGFLAYKIPTVEVRGDLSDITDLFVRINSTGKPLTHSERLHAKYYKSPFMKEALRLARRFRDYFEREKIITPVQVERMKDVEMVSELLVSLAKGGLIHKKEAVDRAIGGESINLLTLNRVSNELVRVMGLMRRLFPQLRETRFHHTSEFYTLFMLVSEWEKQKLVLTDRKRNQIAMRLLRDFSIGVDSVRELQKAAKGAKLGQQLFAGYLLSTQQSTDNLGQRQTRARILQGLFSDLFAKKDHHRLFSPEQRRLLWNSDSQRECKICGSALTWDNFQVDHWMPHSRGGATTLDNAKLLCTTCNRSKGGKIVGRGSAK